MQPTDTTASINRSLDFSGNTPVKIENDTGMFPSTTTPSSTPNSVSKGLSLTPDIKSTPLRYYLSECDSIFVLTDKIFCISVSSSALGTPLNGLGIASTTTGSAPTAMYRPNFSQAFQRAGPYPMFPGQSPFGATTGLLANGKFTLGYCDAAVLAPLLRRWRSNILARNTLRVEST